MREFPKTDAKSPRKVFVKTFGCQMNKHDSERVAGLLAQAGHQPVDAPEDADVLVFNTCAVREHAAQRLYGRVGALKKLKQENPEVVIAVGGCLAQKEGRQLLERLPHVDVVFGTFNLSSVAGLIDVARNGESVSELKTEYDVLPSDLPQLRSQRHHAWVTVSVGCNNHCSYCIVPFVRGREISRPIEEVFAEVERVVADGVTEITLLGQNVNSYGADVYGRSRFADLIGGLDAVAGLERIRFATSHPKDLTGEVIETVARGEKLCEHFHLPVQSGSDRLLRHMKRGYQRNRYVHLVRQIRELVPDSSITTDIIVGYPGESEADFDSTLSLVEEVEFDQAFTFIFSPRAGTQAAVSDDQVSDDAKQERMSRLVALQAGISEKKNRALIGHAVEVFVEGPSRKNESFLTGRTRTNKVVNFFGNTVRKHQMAEVRVTEAHPWHLMGVVKGKGD